ncbi:hypothetical protein QBC36DRAFT_330164 [Triangularia setosa]|uniref:Uncharacterized protein n=1 Tax=Triangularia setosa TaxID=2587417 RepID=A0AAN6W6P1_9PEZI|nr:hypothetical protein QBC36DRAFT_330164 [Podospora setosa]
MGAMSDSVTNPSLQPRDNICDDSTQPFSTPGSREVGELDGDKIDDNLTDRLDNRDDYDLPTMYDSGDDERHCKIDLTDRTGVVVWEDSNREMQHTPDLRMDLHVDASEDQAIFVLHSCVFLKSGKPNKLKLYLFIHPERIQSVEYNNNTGPPIPAMQRVPSNSFIGLRFSMTQPPSFVVPKNRPLVPKARSEGLLDTMKALASVQDFTIYLNMLQLVPEIRYQLSLLPSVFLFNDMKTDERWAAIQRLYHGAGGHVINLGDVAVAPSPSPSNNTSIKETVEDSLPPPYAEKGPLQSPAQLFTPSDRKRRRTSELLSPSTTDKRILLAFGQVVKRNTELEIRLERLEKMVQESAARTPCRYNTEEVEHIIGHVDDRIDDQLTGVHIELEDKVMEGTEHLVAEKTEETQAQIWNGIREGLMEEIREELMEEIREELMEKIREELMEKMREEVKRELMAEIKIELFRDMAQAMMGVACGGNEKVKMSFGAGNGVRNE